MLRFSYYRCDDSQQWDLSGQLAGPWVAELRSTWQKIREHAPHERPVVDLRDVTFIDEAGEQLLVEMKKAGADFVVSGVEHTHLLANLNGGGQRAIRRRIENLKGFRS